MSLRTDARCYNKGKVQNIGDDGQRGRKMSPKGSWFIISWYLLCRAALMGHRGHCCESKRTKPCSGFLKEPPKVLLLLLYRLLPALARLKSGLFLSCPTRYNVSIVALIVRKELPQLRFALGVSEIRPLLA